MIAKTTNPGCNKQWSFKQPEAAPEPVCLVRQKKSGQEALVYATTDQANMAEVTHTTVEHKHA